MADPTTPNLGLATPLRGADSGSWDTPLNANATLLDQMVGTGVSVTSLSNVSVTLTDPQLQNAILRFTGALSANVNVSFPASPICKTWMVENFTTGNFDAFLVNASATSVIGLPPGETCQIYYDGTSFRYVSLERVGTYVPLSVSAVPLWITACTTPPYLNCDGSTFSAVTYPALNRYLGGNTLPDLRGRGWVSLNQGTARITTAGSGIDGNTIKSGGGAETVAIAQANLPSVNLAVTDPRTWTLNNDLLIPAGVIIDSGNIATQPFQAPSTQLYSQVSVTGLRIAPAGAAPTAALGGSAAGLNKMPPAAVGGLMMIRAG